MIRSVGTGFKSSPRYHRGNPNRISSFFMVAGGGLMSSTIFTIPPNLPLSSLAPFRCYGSAKQTSLFCSHLNRNADKGGLWQGVALHCCAIVYTRRSELHACNSQ